MRNEKVLCYCCTCDGISVSRGKKSFVQEMLFCIYFSPSSSVCRFILYFFFQFKKGKNGKEFLRLPPERKKTQLKRGSMQTRRKIFYLYAQRASFCKRISLVCCIPDAKNFFNLKSKPFLRKKGYKKLNKFGDSVREVNRF